MMPTNSPVKLNININWYPILIQQESSDEYLAVIETYVNILIEKEYYKIKKKSFKQAMNLYLDSELVSELKQESKTTDIPVSKYIERLLRERRNK